MPFNIFPARGGGVASIPFINHPFKALIGTVQSGVAATDFHIKCPCDTGAAAYSSQYFFNSTLPVVQTTGELSVKIYSGSMLYKNYRVEDTKDFSFVTDYSTTPDCSKERAKGVMKIYGLDKPIFLQDFFGVGNFAQGNNTLKIWLTVCFPGGIPDIPNKSAFESQAGSNTAARCIECEERAIEPMVAFISCGIVGFPELVSYSLSNKGTAARPRYEKRQISANVPIAEIDKSGNVLRQFCNTNLMLMDLCVQGIPSKFPLAVFSELG